MKLFEKLPPPFKKDGTPSKYLMLVLPFFEKERSNKQEMLKGMGIDLTVNPKKRGSHASTLAVLTNTKVLRTIPRGDGHWYRGDHWDEFLTFILSSMMSAKSSRVKFADLLTNYDSNSMNFIMKI